MTKPIIIFGNAEIASLAKYYFDNDSDYKVVAFTVDDDYATEDMCEGLPLLAFSDAVKEFPAADFDMHVALSYNKLNQIREAKYNQAKQSGYKLVSYVCSKGVQWPDLSIGDNCLILENQTIQPTVTIGNNVMLWSGNHLGHGTSIGDHTYFSSHVVVSGHCVIGERCFLGVNSTVCDFTTIGDDCFIAMDGSVTKNLDSGSVVLGARSTVLEFGNELGEKIRRSYFHL